MARARNRDKPRLASFWPLCRPSSDELRTMLWDLVGWAGGILQASEVLGICHGTLRLWLHKPHVSDPSARAIWLTWAIILHPERLQTVFDLCTWGRFTVGRTRALGKQKRRRRSFGPLVKAAGGLPGPGGGKRAVGDAPDLQPGVDDWSI